MKTKVVNQGVLLLSLAAMFSGGIAAAKECVCVSTNSDYPYMDAGCSTKEYRTSVADSYDCSNLQVYAHRYRTFFPRGSTCDTAALGDYVQCNGQAVRRFRSSRDDE